MQLPKTIDAAKDTLGTIEGLVTAREWERAAIVWAFTEEGTGGPRTARKVVQLSIREFAGLGIAGLRSQDTVRAYRAAWRRAMTEADAPDVKPGDRVQPPDLEWRFPPDAPGDREQRHTRLEPKSFAGALTRGAVDPVDLADALDDQTANAIVRHVRVSPERALEVMSDHETRVAASQAASDAREAAIGPPVRKVTPQPALRMWAVINDLRRAVQRVQSAASTVRDDRLDTLEDDQKRLVANEVRRLRTALSFLETLLAEGPVTDESIEAFLKGDPT
jgi:hypothetical protein